MKTEKKRIKTKTQTVLHNTITLLYMALMILICNTVTAQERYVVTASRLNVRKSPSAESTVVGGLSKGDYISVYGFKGSWVEIEFKNNKAYVAKKFIEKVGGEEPPTITDISYPKTEQIKNKVKPHEENDIGKSNLEISNVFGTVHFFASFTKNSSLLFMTSDLGLVFPKTRGFLPFDPSSCLFATAGFGTGYSSIRYSYSVMGYTSKYNSNSFSIMIPVRIGLGLGDMKRINGTLQVGVVTNFLLTSSVNGDTVHMGFGDRFSWNASLRATFGYNKYGLMTELAIPFQSESKVLLFFGIYCVF